MSRKIIILPLLFAFLVFTGASCIQFGGTQGPVGVYRSSNKGDAWQEISAYPTTQGVKSLSGVKVFRIYTDPSDPNALYLGSRGQGLFYSYDNGDSWQAVSAMNGKYIYGLAVDPKDKCTIFVSDGQHIYQTIDCMRSWKLVFTEERPDQRFVSLAVDYGNSNIIVGAELGGDVVRSINGGSSWRITARIDKQLRFLVADPQNGGRFYIASYQNGLYRSDDSGNQWANYSEAFEDFSDSKTFNRLVINPAQKNGLFWVSKYGILRSDDSGASWDDLPLLTPPGSVNIYSFAVNPQNQKEMYYTGTILGDKNQNVRSTYYRSADGGATWVTKKLPTNTIPVDMFVNKKNGNILFLGFTDAE